MEKRWEVTGAELDWELERLRLRTEVAKLQRAGDLDSQLLSGLLEGGSVPVGQRLVPVIDVHALLLARTDDCCRDR